MSKDKVSDGGTEHEGAFEGVSLRDYFAGQALVGMGTWSPGAQAAADRETRLKWRAQWAYQQADAMLKVRKDGR